LLKQAHKPAPTTPIFTFTHNIVDLYPIMDKFIVSARKYRPQNFATVVGQAHITTTLKNAIKNNQLAHAFLFCGPRGVGKTTCARILAKTINCESKTADGEACDKCNSCVSFNEGTSMNIHELDAASNNSVDDIRSLVEQVRFAPQAGRYKVYIVDEVHMLSSSAFNAFLKTLEEPPPYAIFILATTEKHKILPTILSRCQIFDFKRITNNDTVLHLQEICGKEEIKADKAALHIIAQKSEGCMRDSLSILDKIVSFTNGELTYANTLEHLNILDEDYYFKMLDCMQQEDLPGAMLLFDDINRKGFEGDLVLNGFAEFIRNLLVSRDTKAAILLEVADDFKQKYLQAAQKINVGWMIAALNVLNEAEINYKQARNKRLHVELVLIKLSYLSQAIELVHAEGGISKKKITEGAKSLSFRALPIIEVKQPLVDMPVNGGAKLVIEQERIPAETMPAKVVSKPAMVVPQPESTTAKPAFGSLQKLRQKIADQNREESPVKELTQQALAEAWNSFTAQLKSGNNHSAASNFKDAVLKVTSGSSIEILTPNIISQKFIEAERAGLTAHLQGWFNNRTLTWQVIVEEREMPAVPQEKSLNTKEQYLKLTEEYPMIKELRDKLRLELDY
jgi:DNA polymerase III subunit gamma/tau